MRRKFLIGLITVFLLTSLSCLAFAADQNGDNMNDGKNLVNGARNVVGGAENAVEDAARDVSNMSKNATGDMENGANAMTTDDNNNGNYSAMRTSTDATGEATLMGMTATTWTWIIMAIAAIVIVALVWYYAAQNTQNYDSED